MAKEVILTPVAVADFDNVIDYLTHNWGKKVTHDFIKRFEKVTDLLAESPEIYPLFDRQKQI